MKGCVIVMCFGVLAVSSLLAQEKKVTTLLLNSAPAPILVPVPIDELFTVEVSVKQLAAYSGDNINVGVTDPISTPSVSGKDVGRKAVTEIAPDAFSVADLAPTTMIVKTSVLLELHSMRKNAVDLCLQLPSKYRTRLPECVDIFQHEIRLQSLAKDKN